LLLLAVIDTTVCFDASFGDNVVVDDESTDEATADAAAAADDNDDIIVVELTTTMPLWIILTDNNAAAANAAFPSVLPQAVPTSVFHNICGVSIFMIMNFVAEYNFKFFSDHKIDRAFSL
jgi:glycosyltransferase involved in cell wall biosynthesis